jgi:hypothetical protein
MNSTSYFYNHASQWRYEKLTAQGVGQRRQQLLRGQFFIAPLAGVIVEIGGAVHLPRAGVLRLRRPERRRLVALCRPGEAAPTDRLAAAGAQLLLADIVRPAAAALADAAAEHQQVNHPPVVHIRWRSRWTGTARRGK